MGVVNEHLGKPKEAINFYKKSLKTKFGLYGENHDEVLDLQYKISSIYITNKQYKEAEEIMTAMTDVVLKEKLNSNNSKSFTHQFYRYGVYFYTTGTVLLKNNKLSLAKEYLNKANSLWKDILNPSDPVLNSLYSLIKVCNKKY
jgi:tetratricopeptide (TPR) repeat protein